MTFPRANVSLDSALGYKPDYGAYVNGLSEKYVVLVAEFKHPTGRQKQLESDFIKLGKEMRCMINKLIKVGVEKPVVCGILVNKNCLRTFCMELKAPMLYSQIQLSQVQLIRVSDDLPMLPMLIAKLYQVQVFHINYGYEEYVPTHAFM